MLSNQVRRVLQALTPKGSIIRWTVDGVEYAIPAEIGIGTGTLTAPDVIYIAISTNDGNQPEKHTESGRTATEEDVRDLIERHPSTVDGTAAGLGISSGLSARLIASLKEKGVLREEERGDGTYYFLAEQRHD